MSRDDFTKPPLPHGPRERLAPMIARGRERDVSRDHASELQIETIRVTRLDVGYLGAKGDCARRIEISLPRVKFLERPVI